MLLLLGSGLSVFSRLFTVFGLLLGWLSLRIGSGLGSQTRFFSAGGGHGSVEAWYTIALDIEEVLSGATDSDVHLSVADVIKSFATVDRAILLILSIMLMLGCALSLRLVLVNLGLGMGVFLRAVF